MPRAREPVIVIHVSFRELQLLESSLIDTIEVLRDLGDEAGLQEAQEMLERVRGNMACFEPDPNDWSGFYKLLEQRETKTRKN